jgi:predicted PurR-regulated permease PerM
MALLDRRTISILLTILLFAAAGAFIYRAGHTLVLFLFAIFFAYLLDPAVSRLQRWSPLSKGSRGRAILQVYVVLALVLAVLLLVVGAAPGQGRWALGCGAAGLAD